MTTTADNADNTAFSLRVEPIGRNLAVPTGLTILQAAARGGVILPSSCRAGSCRVCLCHMTSGRVQYLMDWPGLSAEEKRDGWILPCVATALSDLAITQPGALDAADLPTPLRVSRGF